MRFMRGVSRVAVMVVIGSMVGFAAFAEHDPSSGFEWMLDPTEFIRATIFGRGFFLNDTSAKVTPSKSRVRPFHSEGLSLQIRPFEFPLELVGKITFGTRHDTPDGLRFVVAASVSVPLRVAEGLRFRIGHVWEANIGSSSEPARGVDGVFLDANVLLMDDKNWGHGAPRLNAFVRYYVSSDLPLARISEARDADGRVSEMLRYEAGMEFRQSIFWRQLRIWLEPSIGSNAGFTHWRIVPEGGIEYEIPWRNGALTPQLGFRHVLPVGNGYRSETVGWGGITFTFIGFR